MYRNCYSIFDARKLEEIELFLSQQSKMRFLRRITNRASIGVRLTEFKSELDHALRAFTVSDIDYLDLWVSSDDAVIQITSQLRVEVRLERMSAGLRALSNAVADSTDWEGEVRTAKSCRFLVVVIS